MSAPNHTANPVEELYQPLNADRKEIRVLDILPLDSPDPRLKANLRVVSLLDKPYYAAVSYVWGNQNDTRRIWVNGLAVDVTVSLKEVLTLLREPGDLSATVWADAVCINQADLKERGDQVVLMNSIYREAKRVHIWLGQIPKDISWKDQVPGRYYENLKALFAAKNPPAICNALLQRKRPIRIESTPDRAMFGKYTKYTDPSRLDEFFDPSTITENISLDTDILDLPFYQISQGIGGDNQACVTLDPCWYTAMGALRWIFSRAWWRRAWTLQEATVPRAESVLMHAGDFAVGFHPFVNECSMLFLKTGDPSPLSNLCLGGSKSIRSAMGEAGVLSLWTDMARASMNINQALVASSRREATDMRDKLYCMLGLTSLPVPIKPDYTIGFPGVCCIATKLSLTEKEYRLWPSNATGPASPDIPSWAMDISKPLHISDDEDGKFDAPWGTEVTLDPYKAQLEEPFLLNTCISLRAIYIGTIAETVSRTDKIKFDSITWKSSIDGMEIVCLSQELLRRRNLFGSGCAFWRTMFKDGAGWPESPESLASRGQPGNPAYIPFSMASVKAFVRWWPALYQLLPSDKPALPHALQEPVTDGEPEKAFQTTVGDSFTAAQRILSKLSAASANRSFFCTQEGDPGVSEGEVQNGDEVFVVQGSPVPLVLRRQGASDGVPGSEFKLVGHCYLDGWMYGRAVIEGKPWEDIVLS